MRKARNASLTFAAMPEFVVGITLAVLFATTVFTWLPAVAVTEPGVGPWNYPKELILPVITLVIAVVRHRETLNPDALTALKW